MPRPSGILRNRTSGRGQGKGSILPVSLVVVALLLALFSFVTPSRVTTTFDPASVGLPPPTPTPTAAPQPTDVHGGRVVFTCTRQEVNQICIINADGTGYAQLTRGESHSYYPAISRNGTAIVFAVNRYEMFDLYRLSLRAGQGPRSATSRLTQLTDLIGNAFSPSFSPDGRRIIFVNRLPGEASSLWMLAADGQDPRHIYSAPRDIVGAAWSADGTTAAITVEAESHFAYDVFLLDLDDLDAPPRELSIGVSAVGGSVAWSPDATDLLIFAGPAAAREIYRLDVETGATTQLTFGGNNASAAYSPDGQYIVFNSLRNGGQADLYTMRSDGHSMKRLTAHPEPDWQPQWGP